MDTTSEIFERYFLRCNKIPADWPVWLGRGTAGREHVGENLSYFSIDENHALVSIPDGSEIFLGTYNLMFNEVAVRGLGNVFEEGHLHVALNPLVENRSKIYDNGGANIYYS
jgi:hypothetical protein